jgi:predicted kinase
MKVIFTKGLPGCGKSTWARKYVEKNKGWVRINRDDLRNMRGIYWLPKQEDLISQWERDAIVSALNEGLNVIVDATNLSEKYNNNLKQAIKTRANGDVEFEIRDFHVAPEECIKRDLKRANSVGAEVIWGMWYKYLNPPKVYDEDMMLPHCILVDIDGTLAANNSGRSPFDWNRVDEDDLQVHIAGIVRMYYATERTIIILSGRDEVCAELTTDWLNNNQVPFHKLYMRPRGSTEKDTKVKLKMFEDHIKGKYYVDFVLDDRMSVLRMWKSLGLNVLSNNPLAKEF